MRSPPSIFTQSPGSVPEARLDGPSHYESTDIGDTPFELPKYALLPRTRTDSFPGTLPAPSKEEVDVLRQKTLDVQEKAAQGNPAFLEEQHQQQKQQQQQPTEKPNPPSKRKWQQVDLPSPPERVKRRNSGASRRPKLVLPTIIASGEHSNSESDVLKRTASRAPEPSRRSKIPRLSRDDSDLVRAFHPVDFANPGHDPRRPVSPLFFSHTPGGHRPFTARFNSSEAGAQLLEVTGMEDVAGGSVRTVNMARGSMGAMSPPGSHGIPRSSAQQARTNMNRSMSARGPPPQVALQPTGGDEHGKEAILPGMALLSSAGVLELLDQDDRPTFVLDLACKSNYQPGALYVTFANAALRACPGLSEAIRGRGADDTPASFSPSPSFSEFKGWITSFVTNGEANDVVLPSFTYANFLWRPSTLKKRFRVVAGVIANGVSLSMPALSTPGGSTVSNALSASSIPYHDEPADYFGSSALPTLKESAGEHETNGVDADRLQPPTGGLQASAGRTRSPGPSRPDSAASVLAEQLNVEGQGRQQEPAAVRLAASATGLLGSPFEKHSSQMILRAASSGHVEWFGPESETPAKSGIPVADIQESSQYYFDWTRLPMSASLPRHIQFARSVDWASTSLGPIESWSGHLRATSCLIMASPHPAAMYWGDDYVAIYNEPYILLAGQKHPRLMGTPYAEAWAEIWDNVKDSFAQARTTGQSTMKDDDRLFINRSGFLEETYFSWSIIPLVGDDGSVVGLYNPAFEKTRRKIAERRMLTLREVGEKTAAAREVKGFWGAVLSALEYNEYDTPFVLLYSVSDDENSDGSSVHSNSVLGAKQCVLEGTLPSLPQNHPAAPPTIDLKNDLQGFAPVFREAMVTGKHILLETENGTLDDAMLDDMEWRGFNEKPRAAVVSPIHPTTGDSTIGFLVMGINPRRPYDDDYNLFVTLLSRQLATSMASVVLFEEEIRRGQRAAKLAALDRFELSQQLEARTQEAIDSETKFTRMAEFAPVGIFIANKEGNITFTNGVFHSLTHLPKYVSAEQWMTLVKDEDKPKLETLWDDVVQKGLSSTMEMRLKGEWKGNNDARGEVWVLCGVFAEKNADGSLKSIFGSLTDISQQKWAEGIQIKRTEEAIELKRQQSNFIDMTSHEMRNPLSAILQSADEIAESLMEYKMGKDSSQIPMDLIESNIDAAQTISLCANHQTRIVSDVLTLSKLDSALLLVTPVDVQPRVILQQAMKMFEGEMQTADIELKVEIDDKSLDELHVDWVRLDPSRLLQVLINLMTNAIKFTSPEAHRSITISLEAFKEPPSNKQQTYVDYIPRSEKHGTQLDGADWGTGEPIYLHFAVQDTGKGLTDDEKKLLFLRFSQASPKTHVQYGGSGLGLFISRELVELQGGEIGVSSQSGKGSTFAFYVQARKSQPPSGDADGELARSLSTNGGLAGLLRKPSVTRAMRPNLKMAMSPTKLPTVQAVSERDGNTQNAKPKPKKVTGLEYLRILIVEDNLVNQKVLAKQLRNIGCEVSVANHGEEALAHIRKTKYWRENKGKADALELSVILMDLEMPIMDGLTCTRRIREMEAAGELIGHSPIIAVSANARSAHVDSAIEAGMDDVVSKPFRTPELVPKMEELVEKHRGGKPSSATT